MSGATMNAAGGPRSNSPGRFLRETWERLSPLPAGRWLFSRLFGLTVPYARTVRPRILELSPGHARIEMRERRRVRNHLDSIHAVALVNLAEMTTGLALGYSLPDGMRSILTRLSIEYSKKARGLIAATAEAPSPLSSEGRDYEIVATLRDEAGDVVATATATWRVGPFPSKSTRRAD